MSLMANKSKSSFVNLSQISVFVREVTSRRSKNMKVARINSEILNKKNYFRF